jgi:hypothetical protein
MEFPYYIYHNLNQSEFYETHGLGLSESTIGPLQKGEHHHKPEGHPPQENQ